jgi:hypothetical protein
VQHPLRPSEGLRLAVWAERGNNMPQQALLTASLEQTGELGVLTQEFLD